MPYTAPISWTNGNVPTAAQFNQQIRDNLNYIHHDRRLFIVYKPATTADLTTTSTSYVQVPDFSATFTPQLASGRMVVMLTYNMGYSGANYATLSLYLDGALNKQLWEALTPDGATSNNQQFVVIPFLGLTINTPHTIALYWRVFTSGTATLYRTQSTMTMVGVEF